MAKTIVKKKDFVEIDFTGRLKNEEYIFDTIESDIGKKLYAALFRSFMV